MAVILFGSWQCWDDFHCTNSQFALCPVLLQRVFLGGVPPWEKD